MLDLDNAFWRFSVTVYAKPGVAEECLDLQQELGIDVNVLLYCAWTGGRGIVLDVDDLDGIEVAVRTWHEQVVRPLRGVRQTIKTLAEYEAAFVRDLRKSIAGSELRAEQVEQAMLAAIVPGMTSTVETPEAAIRGNIALFLNRHRPVLGKLGIRAPEALIAAAAAYTAA